ncbi:hypothetical protein [[Phormidium ambiguum] IAM M-71]|nr:hypothetical protein [Phormidium ambiguum]
MNKFYGDNWFGVVSNPTYLACPNTGRQKIQGTKLKFVGSAFT